MLVRVKKHPTLGILVASNGMVFNRVGNSNAYKWTFGTVRGKYDTVNISGEIYLVHRLVAETFWPNTEGKPWVDHILRDTHDNNVFQIKWATPSENNRNRVDNIGLVERLGTTDMSTYHKAWYSIHAKKMREKYREKREAGFHYVLCEDGKHHWEKI